MLQIGTQAPSFTLIDDQGKTRSLSDYLGKYILIYFYPKDDTPGCTTEACTIRDFYNDYEKMGITVVGISHDTPETHADFKIKYELPFTLLSDPKKEVITAYGAKGGFMTRRCSYLVDPKGVIVKTYPSVDPAGHAMQILQDVRDIVEA
jgi:thioredoxin-dependent peroxiredoxin